MGLGLESCVLALQPFYLRLGLGPTRPWSSRVPSPIFETSLSSMLFLQSIMQLVCLPRSQNLFPYFTPQSYCYRSNDWSKGRNPIENTVNTEQELISLSVKTQKYTNLSILIAAKWSVLAHFVTVVMWSIIILRRVIFEMFVIDMGKQGVGHAVKGCKGWVGLLLSWG